MGKYLDSIGVQHLWNKVKTRISDYVNDHKDLPGGIAGLDSSGKLNPAVIDGVLKTINNESIVGSGNISIDLSLYKVVESLPTTNIDTNKIYLVLDTINEEGNLYSEYVYVNNKWELFGKYKADVDLTPYVKFTDKASTIKDGILTKEWYRNLYGGSIVNIPNTGITDNGFKISTSTVNAGTGNDIIIPYASITKCGLITKEDKIKLDSVNSNATADVAITEDELDTILV